MKAPGQAALCSKYLNNLYVYVKLWFSSELFSSNCQQFRFFYCVIVNLDLMCTFLANP